MRDGVGGPAIWAFASGKGGVGKSVIAANLAVLLARAGRRTVLVDADLGGANLHTILGMTSPKLTLSDFINRRVSALDDVVVPTPIPGLALVSGTRAFLESTNPSHTQKEKILRHVAALRADDVLLDLGAGSSFNVLDFFLVSKRSIVVVIPEPTSVENTYQFIRSAFYRKLKRAEPRAAVQDVISRIMAERTQREIHSPRDLVREAARLDPVVGEALENEARTFAPAIVLNQVRVGEQSLGDDIRAACLDYFGSPVEYVGWVEADPLVSRSVQERRPAVELFPQSAFSRCVGVLAERLLKAGEVGGG